MPQIRFTVTHEAAAYLRWLARNIFMEKSEHDAARQLMVHRLEQVRREHLRNDPRPDELIGQQQLDGGDEEDGD